MDEVVNHVFRELEADRGGWLVTANLDFLRRFTRQSEFRQLYGAADLIVADGMPLVWASRFLGDPLPERIPGATLLWRLVERSAMAGVSVHLLGGSQGAALAAGRRFVEHWPGLRVSGCSSPSVSDPPAEHEVDAIRQELRRARPGIIFVGLGSPKQERLIERLRADFDRSWMLGVGVSFSFAAGELRRAPPWMQTSGLEWLHRLHQEPRRLGRRYLLEDLPFAAEFLARIAWKRVRVVR